MKFPPQITAHVSEFVQGFRILHTQISIKHALWAVASSSIVQYNTKMYPANVVKIQYSIITNTKNRFT